MPHAKLYTTQRTDTPYVVTFTDPLRREKSGRAKRVSKWFTSQEDAQKHCDALNEKLTLEGTTGVTFDMALRADASAARRLLDLRGHRETTLLQLAQAYVARVTHQAATAEQIGSAIETFLREKREAENRTEATVHNLESRLWAWVNREHISTLGDITRDRIERLRTREGVGRQSRRNDLNAVSSFCSHLVDHGKLPHHPLKGLKRPVIERETPVIYTPDNCAKLLKTARADHHGQWLGTVAIMVFCGLRPSELTATRIFYGSRPIARVEGGKRRGRANRLVPLTPAALAWLKLAGQPEQVEPWNSRARNRILDAAGLTWKADVLRHTYISHRLQLVNNDAQVAREAGTSEGVIYRHYHRLVTPADARKWSMLKPKD